MSLAVQPDDRSTRAALRRVLHAQIAAGLQTADYPEDAPHLHTLRKRTKELRGLLRLLRPGMAKFGPLNKALAAAARGLSPSRDAEVMLASFDALTAKRRSPARFAGLRTRLEQEIAHHKGGQMPHALEAYRHAMNQLDQAIETLDLDDKARRLMWQGIETSWRDARRAFELACRAQAAGGPAEPFHEWRKPLKHHWYQARFLQPIQPEKMKRHIRKVDRLAETLGQHNDLDVLISFLQAQQGLSACDEQARAALLRDAESRRCQLANATVAQGRKLLAQKPKAIVRRWKKWWRRWRDQHS